MWCSLALLSHWIFSSMSKWQRLLSWLWVICAHSSGLSTPEKNKTNRIENQCQSIAYFFTYSIQFAPIHFQWNNNQKCWTKNEDEEWNDARECVCTNGISRSACNVLLTICERTSASLITLMHYPNGEMRACWLAENDERTKTITKRVFNIYSYWL